MGITARGLMLHSAAFMAALSLFASAAPTTPETTRMNVLFFASDDLRMQLGSVRIPGTPVMHTPHLDALAERSLFLQKAEVQQAPEQH